MQQYAAAAGQAGEKLTEGRHDHSACQMETVQTAKAKIILAHISNKKSFLKSFCKSMLVIIIMIMMTRLKSASQKEVTDLWNILYNI